MTSLEATDFVLAGLDVDGGLHITFTRYRIPKTPSSIVDERRNTVSLLFIHGASYHKEMWIPTIEHLFEQQSRNPNRRFVVVEAWAMDAPNHGQAAILNEWRLLNYPQGLSAYEMARAVQVFLKSNLYTGDSLVGIPHSASTTVMGLSTLGYTLTALPYASLICVEPAVMTEEVFARATNNGKGWELLIKMARTRKDTWPSRSAARAWMAERLPWKTWTPRSLDLFVEHALRDLPTAAYPDRTEGVTLCCTREQEVGAYSYVENGYDCLDRLEDLCPTIPVHSIFGGREDMVPNFVKAAFTDPKQGRKMASIRTVKDAGHLVVAENPEGLASAIWGALSQNSELAITSEAKSHL